MRIYADFNAQIGPGLVHLDRLGTLRDLCEARVRLQEGLPLTLYMDSDVNEDIEVDASSRWIADSAATHGGYWAGEFDPHGFRDVPVTEKESVSDWFPCSGCGANLAAEISQHGLSSSTCCGACGVRVHSPIAAPDDGV
jgi:hypothetical protein